MEAVNDAEEPPLTENNNTHTHKRYGFINEFRRRQKENTSVTWRQHLSVPSLPDTAHVSFGGDPTNSAKTHVAATVGGQKL